MDQNAEQNLEVTRGDDLDLIITFEPADGDEIDVTQFPDIFFVLRDKWATTQTDDSDAVFVAKRGAGVEPHAVDAVRLTVPRAVTQTWQKDSYKYAVRTQDAAGKRRQTQFGMIRMLYDASRS